MWRASESWSESGSAWSSGEAWRSTKSGGCRCWPTPPATSATSRSEAREGTWPSLHPRRWLPPTSLRSNPVGPPLTPLERRRAPPRCCTTDVDVIGGGDRKADELKRYKTSSCSVDRFFFFPTRYIDQDKYRHKKASNQPGSRLDLTRPSCSRQARAAQTKMPFPPHRYRPTKPSHDDPFPL